MLDLINVSLLKSCKNVTISGSIIISHIYIYNILSDVSISMHIVKGVKVKGEVVPVL
jgi:hypothetical protein